MNFIYSVTITSSRTIVPQFKLKLPICSQSAPVLKLHCDNEPFLFPDTKYIQAVSGNCSPGLNIEMEKSEEVNEYKVLQDQLLARAYQQKLCITET